MAKRFQIRILRIYSLPHDYRIIIYNKLEMRPPQTSMNSKMSKEMWCKHPMKYQHSVRMKSCNMSGLYAK